MNPSLGESRGLAGALGTRGLKSACWRRGLRAPTGSFVLVPRSLRPKTSSGRAARGSRWRSCCCPPSSACGKQEPSLGVASLLRRPLPAPLSHPSRPVFSSPSQLDGEKAEIWSPGPATAAGLEAEEEMLVTKLGLHSLSGEGVCWGGRESVLQPSARPCRAAGSATFARSRQGHPLVTVPPAARRRLCRYRLFRCAAVTQPAG